MKQKKRVYWAVKNKDIEYLRWLLGTVFALLHERYKEQAQTLYDSLTPIRKRRTK